MTFVKWFGGVAVIAALCTAVPAQAAQAKKPLPAKATAEKVSAVMAKKEPQVTSSTSGPALPANCQRARKRLFVEGEGWVVRRLTTCF
ncbi:hypothetical protein [Microvirga flavescens]|uniref:hypothetical protein n=1 Tax=Microvirga flavescens TaxID=2249811 RepID=UPI0013002A84|nr:hypothetical protein [Microvirga flavescens]